MHITHLIEGCARAFREPTLPRAGFRALPLLERCADCQRAFCEQQDHAQRFRAVVSAEGQRGNRGIGSGFITPRTWRYMREFANMTSGGAHGFAEWRTAPLAEPARSLEVVEGFAYAHGTRQAMPPHQLALVRALMRSACPTDADAQADAEAFAFLEQCGLPGSRLFFDPDPAMRGFPHSGMQRQAFNGYTQTEYAVKLDRGEV